MSKAALALGLAAVVSLAACTSADDTDGDLAGSDQDLIAGADAMGSEYDAIGMLMSVRNDGTRSGCTGTLIAPNVVLTAKHCAMKNANQEGTPTNPQVGRVFFMIGQRAGQGQPTQAAQATEALPSSLYTGGYTSLGSDVAIYKLDRDIVGIEPLQVADAPPSPADVGTKYLAVGYGRQNASGASGSRKMGTLSLRAVTGAPAPLAFGTADEYVSFYEANFGAVSEQTKAALRQKYTTPMSDSYEVYVGNAPGDSQVCHGDSGGPLLKKNAAGKFVVWGVASTTMAEAQNLCQKGGMYAVFGASTRELIADSIGDHCKASSTGVLTCGLPTESLSCEILQPAGTTVTTSPFVACLASDCCATASACFGDSSCSTLSGCFRDCATAADPTACNRACYQANAGAYLKYSAYQTCARKRCSSTAEGGDVPSTAGSTEGEN